MTGRKLAYGNCHLSGEATTRPNTRSRKTSTGALIGHSGAGKANCLLKLGYPATADMDAGLGPTNCPSLADALKWIVTQDSKLAVVSNREKMLEKMLEAKSANPSQFECFFLVYFHIPSGELACVNRRV